MRTAGAGGRGTRREIRAPGRPLGTRPLRGLAEDRLWSEVRPTLADLGLSEQELGTVGYTFTEMVNNAIDHSGGTAILVTAAVSPAGVLVDIADDGIGVFRHVRESLHLPEDVEAVFVLEKGRFTTQPARHTGEGIFFSAKAANRYRLESGRVAWITDNDARDTVFAGAHAHVALHPVGMSESVAFMVHRAGRSPRP